ncbi:MAG: hypothetical protein DMG21_21105 [Acidobacteria bacterium]|nr:MAG: hypothetical protein DMG21_21105 [Acidobacteriota bacterium]
MSNEVSVTTKPGLIDRVGEKVERHLSPILRRVPPRISLLTGSVFVIASLFLPLAMDACGGHATGPGLNIVLGKADCYWPSLFLGGGLGRGFYIFVLVFALAVLVTLVAWLAVPKTLGKASFVTVLFAISGAASLVILADYCEFFVWLGSDALLKKTTAEAIVSRWAPLGVCLLTSVACARCLRAKSVRDSLPIRILFVVAGAGTIATGCFEAYAQIRGFGNTDLVTQIAIWAPIGLYFFAPLSLWFRYGLWPAKNSAVEWHPVRLRLGIIYVPAVAGQFYAAFQAVNIRVWGLIPCLVGIHLITLGYMQLAREAEKA